MRTQLFMVAAMASLVVGCDSDRRDVVAEASDRAEEDTRIDGNDVPGGDACEAEECFLVEADKDISFIAVDGVGCDGRALDLSLWTMDGRPVAIEPSPHGEGTSCTGISPDALKLEGFEGRESRAYRLCVATGASQTLGDLVITTKAGRVCEEIRYDGDCTGCGGTGGSTGTSSSTGGTDATVTVGATASVGVTASASSGAGGASAVSVGVTTGGGEGGCGGASGEGGSPGDTTTVGVTATATVGAGGSGEGGMGAGGMGEGGSCELETDTAVDAVE